MLPVFLQHLPPPVGACGERNYGLFLGIFFRRKKQSRNSDLALNNSHSTHCFIENGHGHNSPNRTSDDTATKRDKFDRKRPLPQLAGFGDGQQRLKSSLLFNQNGPCLSLRRIRPSLTQRSKARYFSFKNGLASASAGFQRSLKERSKAPNWWPGSSPCRGA